MQFAYLGVDKEIQELNHEQLLQLRQGERNFALEKCSAETKKKLEAKHKVKIGDSVRITENYIFLNQQSVCMQVNIDLPIVLISG